MNTTYLILIVLALAIIAALAAYALHLTRKVKAAEQRQAEEEAEAALNLRNKQLELVTDIRFIARSVLASQCDITEGVLRLNYLVNALDPDTWQQHEMSSIRRHYAATASMPILDAYKKLNKKEQFRLDKERLALENEHQHAIKQELEWLVSHTFPSVTLIQ